MSESNACFGVLPRGVFKKNPDIENRQPGLSFTNCVRSISRSQKGIQDADTRADQRRPDRSRHCPDCGRLLHVPEFVLRVERPQALVDAKDCGFERILEAASELAFALAPLVPHQGSCPKFPSSLRFQLSMASSLHRNVQRSLETCSHEIAKISHCGHNRVFCSE